MDETALREQLSKLLVWHDAHADWKSALEDFPAQHYAMKLPGAPHSAWELLEHTRIAQSDILEFCRNAGHVSPEWPAGYWPNSAGPLNPAAWKKSVKSFEGDWKALQALVANPQIDLMAPIPHGKGQTIFREVLLAADHSSYHLGQFVQLRRMLGDWKIQ